MEKLLSIINYIRANKGREPLTHLQAQMDLRQDTGLNSLDLAELTVRIESAFGVDIFAEGIISTVGEILEKINTHP